MEFWQDKRNELIGKLPTIMDVLDRLAYGEEIGRASCRERV